MLKMQGEHQKVDNITYKECNRKTTEFYNIIHTVLVCRGYRST